MSWQATEAVRDSSQITDPSGRLILMVIASYCQPDGTMNNVSNPPSIETLAMGANCHKNTVLNWIPKLEEAGELAVERTGKGRGAKNFYTVKLPIMVQETVQGNSTHQDNGTSQSVPKEENNGTRNLEIMVQNLALMVQELKTMVQVMVQNGTSQDVPVTEYKTKEEDHQPSVDNKNNSENEHKRLMRLYQEALGYPIPNGGQEGKAAKNLLRQYTVDDAIGCYKHLKQTEYWQDKHLSLASVHKQIGAWKQSKNGIIKQNTHHSTRMLEGV